MYTASRKATRGRSDCRVGSGRLVFLVLIAGNMWHQKPVEASPAISPIQGYPHGSTGLQQPPRAFSGYWASQS